MTDALLERDEVFYVFITIRQQVEGMDEFLRTIWKAFIDPWKLESLCGICLLAVALIRKALLMSNPGRSTRLLKIH
jgi:hypothetical protein